MAAVNLELFSALNKRVTEEDLERTPSSVRLLLKFLLEEFAGRSANPEEDKKRSQPEKEKSSQTTHRKQKPPEEEEVLRCSFCGKDSEEVLRIVRGPAVNICNGCVDICNEILAELGVKK